MAARLSDLILCAIFANGRSYAWIIRTEDGSFVRTSAEHYTTEDEALEAGGLEIEAIMSDPGRIAWA